MTDRTEDIILRFTFRHQRVTDLQWQGLNEITCAIFTVVEDGVTERLVFKSCREHLCLIEVITTSHGIGWYGPVIATIGEKLVFSLRLVARLAIHVRKDFEWRLCTDGTAEAENRHRRDDSKNIKC